MEKFFTKPQLEGANKRAIKAGRTAIDRQYIGQLQDGLRYPVLFSVPGERAGWVRCQVGIATGFAAHDYTPVWLDVPDGIYDRLSSEDVDETEDASVGRGRGV